MKYCNPLYEKKPSRSHRHVFLLKGRKITCFTIRTLTWHGSLHHLIIVASSDIIVVTMNSGFDDFLMNWICYASQIETIGKQFVIFSVDGHRAQDLVDNGFHVFTPKGMFTLMEYSFLTDTDLRLINVPLCIYLSLI